jgi:hypothetical protein
MSMVHPQETRSGLRAVGLVHAGRVRNYLLRALVIASPIAAVAIFVWAVTMQYLDPNGLGRPIYWLHDTAYLWIKGQVWVRLFPYALVWVIPLVVLSALAAVEFLLPIRPIAYLQRHAILAMVRRERTRRLLAPPLSQRSIDVALWSESLALSDPVPCARTGFACSVIANAQDAVWRPLFMALVNHHQPEPAALARLISLTEMHLRLMPSNALVHLRALEVFAAFPKAPGALELQQKLAALYATSTTPELVKPCSTALDWLSVLRPEDEKSARALVQSICRGLLSSLQRDAIASSNSPLDVACAALTASVAVSRCGLPEGQMFLRLWVKARVAAAPEGLSPVLARAEVLISFEIWAKLIEDAARPRRALGLLSEALFTDHLTVTDLTEAAESYILTGGAT